MRFKLVIKKGTDMLLFAKLVLLLLLLEEGQVSIEAAGMIAHVDFAMAREWLVIIVVRKVGANRCGGDPREGGQ